MDSLWLTNDRRPRAIDLRQFDDYEYFRELLDQYVDLKIPDVVTVSWQPLRPLLRSLEGDEDREREFVDRVAGLITAGADVPPLLLEKGPQIYDGHHRAWAAWQSGIRLAPTVDIEQFWSKSNPRPQREALVIIHLSSLDSYSDMSEDAVGDYRHGVALGERIADAVVTHDGPVFIADQQWILSFPDSAPRREALYKIRFRPDVTWIRFDEQDQSWTPFLADLRRRLRRAGVTTVRLGGLFYQADHRSGCVTRALLYLKRFFDAKVDDMIVGSEDDPWIKGPLSRGARGYTPGTPPGV